MGQSHLHQRYTHSYTHFCHLAQILTHSFIHIHTHTHTLKQIETHTQTHTQHAHYHSILEHTLKVSYASDEVNLIVTKPVINPKNGAWRSKSISLTTEVPKLPFGNWFNMGLRKPKNFFCDLSSPATLKIHEISSATLKISQFF